MKGNIYREDQGSILVMAVVLSFVTVLLGVTFLTYAVTLHDTISREIAKSQVLYDAQAGVYNGLADQIAGRQLQGGLRNFYDDNKMGYDIDREGNEEIDIGTLHQISVRGLGLSDYEDLGLTGELNVKFSWETYADYLYISNYEEDPLRHGRIYFWTPDTLDGKVHSNDTIWIQSAPNDRPRFMKRVTTTPNKIMPPGHHARFDDTDSPGQRSPILFPDQAEELRNVAGWAAGTQGHDSLTQLGLSGQYIFYRKCGKYHVNGVDKIRCDPSYMGQNYIPIPPSGVIFIYGKTWVSAARGRTDRMDGLYPDSSFNDGNFVSQGFGGQLTIGSADTMIIVDNLIYQRARTDINKTVPTTMDSCSDLLGLVSENYIMIGRYVTDTVYVQAAMAAMRGAISVQDIYWSQPPDWDNEKQSLFVTGSLAMYNRGLVHTHEPYYHLRGFIEKDYHYDVRLMDNPPPHFMRTGDVKLQFLDDLFASGAGGD
jgi:hypothetical protein